MLVACSPQITLIAESFPNPTSTKAHFPQSQLWLTFKPSQTEAYTWSTHLDAHLTTITRLQLPGKYGLGVILMLMYLRAWLENDDS